jgi:uncharacterized protein DUF992
MKPILPAIIALGTALSVASPALAVQDVDTVKLGALNCVVEGGAGYIFGSSKDLACTYTPADSSQPEETYVGTINKYGLDIGVTGKALMSWAVVAPADSAYAAGQLSGDYVGASASASFAAGLGANVLVGNSDSSVALQPVSVQAQEGVNVAAGIAELTLVGVQG